MVCNPKHWVYSWGIGRRKKVMKKLCRKGHRFVMDCSSFDFPWSPHLVSLGTGGLKDSQHVSVSVLCVTWEEEGEEEKWG